MLFQLWVLLGAGSVLNKNKIKSPRCQRYAWVSKEENAQTVWADAICTITTAVKQQPGEHVKRFLARRSEKASLRGDVSDRTRTRRSCQPQKNRDEGHSVLPGRGNSVCKVVRHTRCVEGTERPFCVQGTLSVQKHWKDKTRLVYVQRLLWDS